MSELSKLIAEEASRPVHKPALIRLREALSEEDWLALEAAVADLRISAPTIVAALKRHGVPVSQTTILRWRRDNGIG